MNFQPSTPEQIEDEKRKFAEQSLLQPGWYDFEVLAAEEAVSKKSGKDMIKLTLKVFGPQGQEKWVYDYLIETAATRLWDFCESVGLDDAYSKGNLTAEACVGRSAKVKLAIDNKDKNYDPKNVVKAYAVTAPTTKASSATGNEPDDDEIPF